MDKTDNKTETQSDKSNRNKEGLPFTDSAIQKWLPSFSERGDPRFIEIPFNIKNIRILYKKKVIGYIKETKHLL